MGAINFGGAASGLDTNLIIDSLLGSKQQKVQSIQDRIASVSSTKSILGSLKSTLSNLNSLGSGLSDVFGKRSVESSDKSAFTAKATSDAVNGEYQIEVSQLAKKSTVTIGGTVSDTAANLGGGTVSLDLADGSNYSVTLDAGSSSLSDVRDAINNDFGDDLQASILETEPGQFQLVVSTRNTGGDFDIDTGTSSFSGFSDVDFTASGITKNADGVGQDAIIKVDGIQITRADNEIDDVIDGVTINLLNTTDTDAKETLKIDTDLEDLVAGVQKFVDGYNQARDQLESLSRSGGQLAGDSSIQLLKNELQSIISRAVPNAENLNSVSGISALSQLGFETDRKTGKLSFDSEDFQEALEDNFDEVQNLFTGGFTSSNSNVDFLINTGEPFSGTIVLDLSAGNETATIDGNVYTLNRDGQNLTFEDGSDYDGIILTAAESLTSGTVTLEISAGLGALIENETGKYTDFSGVLDDRTSRLDEQSRSLNQSLDDAQQRVENERARLTQIFARAEQAISQLQGLQQSLGAQGFG